jgi:hypothetical protein
VFGYLKKLSLSRARFLEVASYHALASLLQPTVVSGVVQGSDIGPLNVSHVYKPVNCYTGETVF